MNKLYIVITLLFISVNQAIGQNAEMADKFRSDGKIYVVVGVILILLLGLFIYLFRIEKRVKKLEEK